MQVGGYGSTVVDGDPDQDVRRRVLRVFRDHIEVTVAFEHAGVGQLELRILFAAPSILLYEVGVRKLLLRVLVEGFEVRMRRRRVHVVVALLDVFAVVPLAVGEAKQPFLQDRVASVPQGDSETERLLLVADAHDAVFTPTVGAAAGRVVAERVPGSATGAVILTNRAPLALTQIRSPRLPAGGRGLVQASLFVHDMPLLQGGAMTVVGCRRVSDVTRNSKTGSASNR